MKDDIKDIELLIKKSFSPIVSKTYDTHDNTTKQNELNLNIIASNLGVVHYLEDLLNEVIEKVKSRYV